jgi:hypothetical protein
MGLTKDLGSIPRAITVDSSNRVGIGTPSPESGWRLDVSGTVAMGSTTGNGRLYISCDNTTNGATNIQARNLSVGTPLHFFSSFNYFEQNVSIGTSTNAGFRLDVNGTGRFNGILSLGTASTIQGQLTLHSVTSNAEGNIYGRTGGGMLLNTNANAHPIEFGGSRIQFNSNVGINNNSPVTKLTLNGYSGSRLAYINGTANSFNSNGITVASDNSNNTAIGGGIDLTNNIYSIGAISPIISFSSRSLNGIYNNNYAAIYGIHSGDAGDGNWSSGHLVFATTQSYGTTERMRITSSGEIAVGKTSGAFGTAGVTLFQNGQLSSVVNGDGCLFLNRLTNDGTVANFYRSSSGVGSITVTTSSTSYNTSSDYRLKEDIKPVENALKRLQDIKPVNFAWKIDGTRVDGFIAHELAEVIPEAVTGEKDEIKEDGTPIYQGIDQSKIVPLLVAAIQELTARLEILENK